MGVCCGEYSYHPDKCRGLRHMARNGSIGRSGFEKGKYVCQNDKQVAKPFCRGWAPSRIAEDQVRISEHGEECGGLFATKGMGCLKITVSFLRSKTGSREDRGVITNDFL